MGSRNNAMRTKTISRTQALLVVIVSLFMGTTFTFGMQYRNKLIERDEAIPMTAAYETYDVHRSRRSTKYIQLSFQDSENTPNIDGCCVTDNLINLLQDIPAGAEVSLLLHPNSDTVLDMMYGEQTILSFEEAQQKLNRETLGFRYIGWFLFAGAIVTGIKLIRGWKKGWIRI